MNNPYDILGVSRNASEQQIMDAYKIIAASIQNSSSSESEKQNRMRELDEAYDTVMNEKRGTSSYASNSSQGYYNQYSDSQFSDVRQCINSGRIDDAETILDGVPSNMRTAEWHYLKGVIHQRRGWLNDAYRCYHTAYTIDPSNPEFAAAFNAMNNNANGGYRTVNQNNSGCSPCNVCAGLLCADTCCECMGGDLISCC